MTFLLSLLVTFYATSLVATIIHETGHVVAARMLTRLIPTKLRIGYGPLPVDRSGSLNVELRLMPFGGEVKYA